jgi:hypothetical protein
MTVTGETGVGGSADGLGGGLAGGLAVWASTGPAATQRSRAKEMARMVPNVWSKHGVLKAPLRGESAA